MAVFPAVPLPAVTDLLIDGVWTEAEVREASAVAITRGRANESGRVAPSRCNLVLDNETGDYSNRLPTALYYGKLGRNTPLRHRLRWIQATFTSSVSSAWPAADTGQAWTNTGGAASDFLSSSGFGRHTHTSVNVFRSSVIETNAADQDITADVKWDIASATGAFVAHWVCARYTDASNYYTARLSLTTGGAIQLGLLKRVAGVLTGIDGGALTLDASHGSGEWWTVRISVRGSRIRASAWPQGTTPPTSWQIAVTDTGLTTGTKAACLSRLESGNTNTLNVTASWDNFEYNDFRFWGEVPAWPQTWDVSGADITAPIEAAGIMRRLGGSKRPLRSALTRAMAGISAGDFVPIAHWPMEDGSDATSFASNISGQAAATITGSVSPGSYSGFAGSEPLPVLNDGGRISAPMPVYADTGHWQMQFTLMVPSSGFSNDADMVIVDMLPGHPCARIYVTYQQSSGRLLFTTTDVAGAVVGAGAALSGVVARDTPYLVGITDAMFSGDHIVVLNLYQTNGVGLSTTLQLPDGPGAGSPGVPARVTALASSVSSGWSFGQLALYTADVSFEPSLIPNAQASGGYVGETATDRMTRLCREEGIYLEVIGDTSDSAPMGPQASGKLLDLLFDCADTDLGILYEPRDALGLAYRTRPSLYNQTGLTLDYAASQVFPPFAPTEDDQLIVNDAIARRLNGSWARVTAEPGPLSTDEPPAGVGTYPEDRTYNLAADGQLLPVAGWRVHVGSWDEARYPQVHVMLEAPAFSASPTLTAQAAAVDIGDYLSIDNPPANLPPDLIELLAQGYREVHHTFEWDITWNAVPAGPYRVFVLDQDRLEGDHALASSVTTSATSWSVKTLSGPLLSTTDTGQQWMCEGELVTVTAVSGGASPQTVTVTRNANGIPGGKAHGADAPVTLHPAPYLAL